jgi:hypothetical protein
MCISLWSICFKKKKKKKKKERKGEGGKGRGKRNKRKQDTTDADIHHCQSLKFSWPFLIAHSKARLHCNENQASSWLAHSVLHIYLRKVS